MKGRRGKKKINVNICWEQESCCEKGRKNKWKKREKRMERKK